MVILYILLVLVAVILARTFMFTPKAAEKQDFEEIEQDTEASVRNLAALVKCRTVSYEDPALEDDAEFEKLIALLPELYPNVWATCPLQRFPGPRSALPLEREKRGRARRPHGALRRGARGGGELAQARL